MWCTAKNVHRLLNATTVCAYMDVMICWIFWTFACRDRYCINIIRGLVWGFVGAFLIVYLLVGWLVVMKRGWMSTLLWLYLLMFCINRITRTAATVLYFQEAYQSVTHYTFHTFDEGLMWYDMIWYDLMVILRLMSLRWIHWLLTIRSVCLHGVNSLSRYYYVKDWKLDSQLDCYHEGEDHSSWRSLLDEKQNLLNSIQVVSFQLDEAICVWTPIFAVRY